MKSNNNELSCCLISPPPRFFDFKYNEKHPAYEELQIVLSKLVVKLGLEDVQKFNVGLNHIVDYMFGEIVEDFMGFMEKTRYYLVIPYKEKELELSAEYQQRYRLLMKYCSNYTIVSNNHTNMSIQNYNQYLINKSDIIIAIYDRNITHTPTIKAIELGIKLNKKIIYLDSKSFLIQAL